MAWHVRCPGCVSLDGRVIVWKHIGLCAGNNIALESAAAASRHPNSAQQRPTPSPVQGPTASGAPPSASSAPMTAQQEKRQRVKPDILSIQEPMSGQQQVCAVSTPPSLILAAHAASIAG